LKRALATLFAVELYKKSNSERTHLDASFVWAWKDSFHLPTIPHHDQRLSHVTTSMATKSRRDT